MPSRRDTKRAALDRWLAEHQPATIDGRVLSELKTSLGPVSDSYLRDLVRRSGFPLAAEVEGVNVQSLEDLERTLLALAELYEAGRRDVRLIVIAAKDRLRWAQKRSSDHAKKDLREEMILWTLTWLENPGAFGTWVRLRSRQLVSR